jgi:Tfp pilus assembly protein PilF
MRKRVPSAVQLLLLALLPALPCGVGAQTRGSMTLFGDVKVDESQAGEHKIGTLTIVLYVRGGATIIGRQTVPPGGRYRFNNISGGEYDLAVEVDMTEIARVTLSVAGRPGSDFQHDLEFAWKPSAGSSLGKAGTVSAADAYQRSSANQSLFESAQRLIDTKKYDESVALLMQIVTSDNADFQAWTELGTAYMLAGKKSQAEESYENALKARPTFKLALLNLGRLRVEQKKYEEAIVPLTALIEIDPASPDGNLALGEAYLQIKKGSKAVTFLNEAAKLGRPDAHLWLARLYDAAKLKDRAAAEYRQFLQKRPNYADRQKLEKYIAENGKN